MVTREALAISAALTLAAPSGAWAQQVLERPPNPLLCPVDQHPEQKLNDEHKRRRDLLLKSRWAELEAELDQLRAKGRLAGAPTTALEQPLDWLSDKDDLAAIDSWCRASRRHWPQLARGRAGIQHAWAARGSGYASTVTDDGRKKFGERLALAGRAFQEAERRDPKCAEAPTGLITVAMGSGAPEEVARAAFARAVAADPGHIPAYKGMATYLLPRWHGTPEALLDFVDKSMKEHPDEPALSLVLAYALDWMEAGLEFKKRKDVQAEMHKAYDRVLARYPRCAEAWTGKAQLAELVDDHQRRYEAFYEAAELGDRRAMWAVAHHEIFNPHNLPPDRRANAVRDGLRHLCRAATHGEATAMAMLGQAFEADKFVPQDLVSAAYWYRMAIGSTSDVNMKNSCRVRAAALVIDGYVPPSTPEEVARKLGFAREAGHVDATAWLGRAYAEGKGVPVDVKKGVTLLAEAMEAGSAVAEAFLGRLLVEGQLVQRDVAQGTRLLNLAAQKKDAEANLLLGRWAKDPARGLAHLREAYLHNHPAAGRAVRDHLKRNPSLQRVDTDPPDR